MSALQLECALYGALSQEGFDAPKIDYDKCIKCGKCSNFCPKKALVLENN